MSGACGLHYHNEGNCTVQWRGKRIVKSTGKKSPRAHYLEHPQ
jgi:hypothetical protein